MTDRMLFYEGYFLIKLITGYYKRQYLVLKNQELYIYSSKLKKKEEEMFVLTSSSYIKVMAEKKVSLVPGGSSKDDELTSVFPIAVFHGGEIANFGAHNHFQDFSA